MYDYEISSQQFYSNSYLFSLHSSWFESISHRIRIHVAWWFINDVDRGRFFSHKECEREGDYYADIESGWEDDFIEINADYYGCSCRA